MAATARIIDFLRDRRPDGPCLVVDLDVIAKNYRAFARAMPGTRIFYAVKANPAPEVLALLARMGSCFDAASVPEIEMALAAGATPDRISYGNTIKKERDIARAHALGVSLYAADALEEVEKVARAAPGASVFCRILANGVGAEWPLSRKFGCDPSMAQEVLLCAHRLGLKAYGISFHVGSQQTHLEAWDTALAQSKAIFDALQAHGVTLSMVNLGGGFPARYLKPVPGTNAYASSIHASLVRHFGNAIPETIIEPGRGLVGNAGAIKAEVVLVSKKHSNDNHRWVYLDIGKFGGLAETMEEAIRYPIVTAKDSDAKGPCIIAGPTCDSADVLYEKTPYNLPLTLTVGDEVLIESTGAYTST
ncbi:MAG: type III PLP-dependent enzyme, partial [Aestuariivirga sp.]